MLELNPRFILDLTKETFQQRIDFYQNVLEPYFDLAEQMTGGKVDRLLTAFTINNLFVALTLFGSQDMPYTIDIFLKKIISAVVMIR